MVRGRLGECAPARISQNIGFAEPESMSLVTSRSPWPSVRDLGPLPVATHSDWHWLTVDPDHRRLPFLQYGATLCTDDLAPIRARDHLRRGVLRTVRTRPQVDLGTLGFLSASWHLSPFRNPM